MVLEFLKGVISYDIDGIYYQKSFTSLGDSPIPHGTIHLVRSVSSFELYSVVLIPDKHTRFTLHTCTLSFQAPVPVSSVFSNGFQSWTVSQEYESGERERPLSRAAAPWVNTYHLKTYGDQHFYTYRGEPGLSHSHTYTYLRHDQDQMTLIASLSERWGYTIFETSLVQGEPPAVQLLKECEALVVSESIELCCFMVERGGEQQVFSSWAKHSTGTVGCAEPASGWTSWYTHYDRITESIVRKNLKAFSEKKIPIDYFQIDDGWQQAVGDWMEVRATFPGGMKALADEIRTAGYTPGLWLAPFVAVEHSAICEEHADWIVRDTEGRPVPAGYDPKNWGGTFYALDIDLPEVQKYLRRVFTTVRDLWGYGLVKLDFLYAAALIPRHGKSRGQIMYEGMELLRELCGPMKIIGCGVPLGSAAGKVDYCRIGGDISPGWEDRRLSLIRYRERVSTVDSLKNTIGRRQLDRTLFLNDPDVIMLRSEQTSMSTEQRYTLLLVNNLFGSLIFTSDDIDSYDEQTLSLYESLFPLRTKHISSSETADGVTVTRFSIGERAYLAVINLTSKRRTWVIPEVPGAVLFTSGLQGERPLTVSSGESVTLPPHTSRCMLIPDTADWGVLGTTDRLFPGSEIHCLYAVQESDGVTVNLYGELESRVPGLGSLYVRLPRAYRHEQAEVFLHGSRAERCLVGGIEAVRFDLEHLL